MDYRAFKMDQSIWFHGEQQQRTKLSGFSFGIVLVA
jgi:hypothetical protein